MTAAAQDQWRLLDVQGHDTRLAQIAHRRRTLPEHAEIEALEARVAAIGDELVTARTAAQDVGRELVKAEGDVEQVASRLRRDQARLESGLGTAKDLQALQHEVGTLEQRKAVLEDVELEVMQRAEDAEAEVARLVAEQEQLAADLASVVARRDEQLAALAEEAASVTAARTSSAAGVPAELLALYERVREKSGGVGAARIHQRRCEGCRLELNSNDLGRVRAAGETEVLRCEECGRIQVRTPDSGL